MEAKFSAGNLSGGGITQRNSGNTASERMPLGASLLDITMINEWREAGGRQRRYEEAAPKNRNTATATTMCLKESNHFKRTLIMWAMYKDNFPVMVTRVAAILLEIDANDLNKVLASRHFIMLKIGDFLGCSEHAFLIARSAKLRLPYQAKFGDVSCRSSKTTPPTRVLVVSTERAQRDLSIGATWTLVGGRSRP